MSRGNRPLRCGGFRLLFPAAQVLFKHQQKHRAAHTGGDRVGQRLGVKSRPRAPKDRQDQGEQHKAALAEQGQRQRGLGAGQGGEPVHPGVLHRQRDDGQGEHPQPPGRQLHQGRVGGEDAHHLPGQQLEHHEEHRREPQAHPQHAAGGLAHPVALAGAVVVADDGLGAAADAQHGAGDQGHAALHNGGAGDQQIPLLGAAVPLQHRVHGDQDQAVGSHDEERGEPDGRHPQHQPPVGPAQADPDGRPAKQEPHGKGAAEELGQHRGRRRAGHPHIQREDEDRVQQDVGHRADQHRRHAHRAEALAGDKIVQPHRHQGEEGARRVDGHVGVRVAEGGAAGPKTEQQRPAAEQKTHGQHRRQAGQH